MRSLHGVAFYTCRASGLRPKTIGRPRDRLPRGYRGVSRNSADRRFIRRRTIPLPDLTSSHRAASVRYVSGLGYMQVHLGGFGNSKPPTALQPEFNCFFLLLRLGTCFDPGQNISESGAVLNALGRCYCHIRTLPDQSLTHHMVR